MKRHKKLFLLLGLLLIIFVICFLVSNEIANAPRKTSGALNKSKQIGAQSFNKSKYSLTDPTSIWVVVNKLNPLNPTTYAPANLTSIGNGQYLRKDAAKAFSDMIADAAKHGLPIIPLSGYRSYQTQVVVYGKEVSNYGRQTADSESARPGYSEHQTGFAVDVGGGGCGIENCFAFTKQGQWLVANAYKFGFIIRYPADKASITGYRNEPWHMRYVGNDLAGELHKQSIKTLEEFFDLPAAPNY